MNKCYYIFAAHLFEHLSDLLRLAVVSLKGGMYADFDMICLRTVEKLRNFDALAVGYKLYEIDFPYSCVQYKFLLHFVTSVLFMIGREIDFLEVHIIKMLMYVDRVVILLHGKEIKQFQIFKVYNEAYIFFREKKSSQAM